MIITFYILASILLSTILFLLIFLNKSKKPTKKSIYTGETQNGLRQGKGKILHKSGDTYEGNFQNNQRHGYGTYTWKSGLKYEGQWENGERSGWGQLKSTDNSLIYEGFWSQGQCSGQGKKVYTTGVYEGNFFNNKENGFGKFLYKDSSVFEGYWLEGCKNGFGTLYDRNRQKVFEGTWAFDMYNGEGTEYSQLGTYKGSFRDGLRDGDGKFLYNDGRIFEGFWKEGEKSGWGTLFDRNKRKVYEGFWVNGEKNGFGAEFYGSSRFEGDFRDGKKNGNGKMIWESGVVVPGVWENDVKVGTDSKIKVF